MNKALHALVYIFLVLAAAGLWFEMQLNAKRTLLTDRNRMQENYLVKIAKTIEKAEPSKGTPPEVKKDVSPVEARLVDSPETENVLDEYHAELEQGNLDTYNWDNMNTREQLRRVYVTDADGNPVMDGNQPLMTGPGTEDELLAKLFESAKAQQARLNSTRAELPVLRGKVEALVTELNKIKPEQRQALVTIEEKKEQITTLEGEKSQLENQVTKLNGQIEELNTEVTGLKDEVNTAKEETEAVKEDLTKAQDDVKKLKELLKASYQNKGNQSVVGAAVSSLPAGVKGKVVEADNENMFCIVEFSPEALKDLKGENGQNPMGKIELGVKRAGYKGQAGEFVGRVRIRQEVKGKPYAICDILSSWTQDSEHGIQPNDELFAD